MRENYDDKYASLREALSPDYADLSSEAIEQIVESLYPGADPADVENFFKKLKNAGKGLAKIGKRALPGIIQGVTKGGALGPWGALAGGIAGGALSAAGGGRGKKGGFGGAVSAIAGLAKRLPSRGALGGLTSFAGSPAAAQLLGMINRPEIGQALRSLAMGGAGRRNVNIGGMNVPTAAITSALRQLLERVETELHEHTAGESTGTPLYLFGEDGEFAVDPTDEIARAERVFELLASSEASDDESSEPERASERYSEDDEGFRFESYDEDDELTEDDELEPEDQARLLYPGVYGSTQDD